MKQFVFNYNILCNWFPRSLVKSFFFVSNHQGHVLHSFFPKNTKNPNIFLQKKPDVQTFGMSRPTKNRTHFNQLPGHLNDNKMLIADVNNTVEFGQFTALLQQ